MKEMNFVCVSQKKSVKYNYTTNGVYRKNKLKQQFNQKMPNSVWVSDITNIYVNYKQYCLCVIIDLFSRKVISYRIDNNQETPIAVKTFIDAFENRNRPAGLMFHSDQGCQYVSYEFRKHLRQKKVNQSFSNPGCPYDNAVAESFFRTLKAEEVYRNFYQTVEQLNESIAEYITFFNSKRPYQKLGYLTPDQFEELYLEVKEQWQ